jgi:hypothetical protein
VAWMSVSFECCVLSGRGLGEELITRPEESYRLCCVVVCDLETSTVRRSWHALGSSATGKKLWLDFSRPIANQSLVILLLVIEWKYSTRMQTSLLIQEKVIMLLLLLWWWCHAFVNIYK